MSGPAGRDPVAEFFAAQRAQVREEPADDLAWQRIRDGRQRHVRARRGAWAGGLVAAAAALLVVLGPALLPDAAGPDLAGPEPSATDAATDAASGDPASGDPAEPTGPAEPEPALTVTTPAPEAGMPAQSWFADVSATEPEQGADSGVRYAVLLQDCAEQEACALLARSEDGGTTWAPTADLRGLGVVDRVTFADQSRGWAWGAGGLWTTTDGGRTWTRVDVGADTVREVSVRGDGLLVTTLTLESAPCLGADCPPPTGAVVVTDPTATDWRDSSRLELGPLADLTLLAAGDQRYVAGLEDNAVVGGLWRVEDGALESTATLLECGGGPVALAAAQQDPQHLWALCDDVRGLSAQRSDTGARTWAPTNLTVPSFVLGEQPPLMASVSADHLLLVGSGNYALTTDGGQTWSTEAFLPGAVDRPSRLEVTTTGEVLAYPAADQGAAPQGGDGPGLWRSLDQGATWEVVQGSG